MELIPILFILGYVLLGLITVAILVFYILKRIKEKSEETFEDRRN
jgi:hypothetical protein